MNLLLRALIVKSVSYFTDEVQIAFAPAVRYAKKLGLVLAVLAVSAIAWVVGLIFLLLSLFFYWGDATALINPALWTGLVSLAVGVVLTFFGLTLFRRPG